MASIEGPYVTITVTASSTNNSVSVERSLVGPDGPWVMLQPTLPLLDGTAFYVDTTAPILNSGATMIWYRFVSDVTEDVTVASVVPPDPDEQVWLTDPLRPWADLALDTCSTTDGHEPGCSTPDPEFVWGGFTGSLDSAVDVGLFDVLNAERPADIYARRKYAEGSFMFFTRSLDAIDRVYDLFTAGGPIMIRVPQIYGFADQIVQPGTVQMEYMFRDQRRPERQWNIPFVIVDAPFGPVQGTDCNNWCEIEEAFTTMQDLTNYGGTWESILNGDVLCPDTPPELDGFGMGPFGDGPFGDGG